MHVIIRLEEQIGIRRSLGWSAWPLWEVLYEFGLWNPKGLLLLRLFGLFYEEKVVSKFTCMVVALGQHGDRVAFFVSFACRQELKGRPQIVALVITV